MTSIFKFYQKFKKIIVSLEIEKSKKLEKIKIFYHNNFSIILTQNFE
jgi:hypothetical protein